MFILTTRPVLPQFRKAAELSGESYVVIKDSYDNYHNTSACFSVSINGTVYNADKSLNIWEIPEFNAIASSWTDSGGKLSIYAKYDEMSPLYKIILSPSETQRTYSTEFIESVTGNVSSNGDLYFRLQYPHG